ncbi:MAG: hypothetical protein HKP21_01800 [Xanthomonadales bacterium]|nr:hypothetical protein [Gammaproteobacteria bacterium]NNK03259.1 hypothetical protein [Xanthomonadales bacterium]
MKTRFLLLPPILLTASLASAPARALETDQFYAWGKPIDDSSQYLNAWVQLQFEFTLDSISAGDSRDCESVVGKVQKRLQHSIYQPIELWILSSDLVDRIPRDPEADKDYRSNYLLAKTFTLDYGRLLQPSPTLQVNDIRFGSDKLAHFFSEGWWYYKHWKKNREELSEDALQHELFQFGVNLERWIQGTKMTGVFSPADLESNYQGFIFYRQLCHGEQPLLYRRAGRWHFSDSFDIGDYIQPEWDESWNPNVYSPLRWKNIRTTMAGYCPALDSDWVVQQRAHYAQQDTQTPTEKMILELVARGELPDPQDYDIAAVCGQQL